jgi:hypothetical protein
MAYDGHGHPIVDGRPFNEEEYADEAYNRGMRLDGKAVEANNRALIATAKERKKENAGEKS